MQKFHPMAALWLAGAAAGAAAQTAGTGKTGKPSGSAVNDTAGRCAAIADENKCAMCRDAAGLGKPKK